MARFLSLVVGCVLVTLLSACKTAPPVVLVAQLDRAPTTPKVISPDVKLIDPSLINTTPAAPLSRGLKKESEIPAADLLPELIEPTSEPTELTPQPENAPVPVASSVGRNLVREIQIHLDRLGFDVGNADGQAGPRTQKALRTFQQVYNLPDTGQPSRAMLDVMLEQ